MEIVLIFVDPPNQILLWIIFSDPLWSDKPNFSGMLAKLCALSSFFSVLVFLICRLRQPSRPLTRSGGPPFAFKCGISPVVPFISVFYLSPRRHACHWQKKYWQAKKSCEKIYFH
jgi:hypothetical protein